MPSEWPIRFIPRRTPPLWQAALITLGAFAGAILIRGLFLGFDNAFGLSATYFPAFIVATLYAGPRWGWGTLATIMVTGYLGPNATISTISRTGVIIQFGVSGAATVMVAAALRETLLRLDEAKDTAAKIAADLVATEARFRMLADSAPVRMWLAKPNSQREFVNHAYAEFLGVPYEAAIAIDWRDAMHPDDMDRLPAFAAQRAVDPAGTTILEARYRRGDGEYRWIRSVSLPRRLPGGEVGGYIGVGYDISDAKQAQADLTRINDLLAERVQASV